MSPGEEQGLAPSRCNAARSSGRKETRPGMTGVWWEGLSVPAGSWGWVGLLSVGSQMRVSNTRRVM